MGMEKVNKPILETTGERIRVERKKLHLTLDGLANLTNMSKQQISNYELNKRQPDYKTILEIAKTLNVSTDYLLGNTESKSIENTETSRKLGLSDKSIEKLKKITRKSSFDSYDTPDEITNNKYNSVIINKIIEDENFETLIYFIKKYINSFKIEKLKREIILNTPLYVDENTGKEVTNEDILIDCVESGIYNKDYQESTTDMYAYKINSLFNKIIENIVKQVEPTFAEKWTLNDDKTKIVYTKDSKWKKYKNKREGKGEKYGGTRNNKK